MVDQGLSRGQYRVTGRGDGRGYVVRVDSVTGAPHLEFPVTREELATDARAEWVAITIARKVKAASAFGTAIRASGL